MPILEQVLERFPNEVKIVFKNFPLRSHTFAMKAALAAAAAGKQGKFWEFHDQLYKFYNQLNDRKIDEIAVLLGLNRDRWQKDMAAPETAARINADLRNGYDAGVRGTPTVFINGILLRNKTLQGFEQAIRGGGKRTRK